jgi:hypothetical protein
MENVIRKIARILVWSIVAWTGYTAALVLGGIICTLFKIAISFLSIWFSMLGLVCVIFGLLISIVVAKHMFKLGDAE